MHTMKRIMFAALIGLLSNFAVLPLYAQPVDTGDCTGGADSYVIEALSLEHAKPVTVDYQPGQTVTLAGDAEGQTKLVGRSVVAVNFAPSGHGLGYGVESESLPPQDVTSLMITGPNTVSLTAVDARDCAWLIITGQCAGADKPDAIANAVATPTRVLIPTPTPAAITEVAIISHTVTVSHTDAMTDGGHEGSEATVREALMQRLGRILLAAALLGLIVLFTMSDLYRLRHELMKVADWCKRDGWNLLVANYESVKARMRRWLKRLQ